MNTTGPALCYSCLGASGAALSLAIGVPIAAAQVQTTEGRIVKLPGECITRAEGDLLWAKLSLSTPLVKEGQRVKCSEAGELQLILPGSGVPHRFHLEIGVEYVVPLGQHLPALRLQPGARISQGPGEQVWTLPEVRVGGIVPGGTFGSVGNTTTASKDDAAGGPVVANNGSLERCSVPLGTLAIDDGRGKEWYASFGQATQVISIEPLLRLAVQQSNCFVITSIGNNRMEGRISAITDKQRYSGEFLAGSKQEKGQRVAADYYLEPQIIINNDSTGKVAGALGGLIGRGFGGIAGSLENKASVVTLTLMDIRSGVQIGISEGNSTATNFGEALGAFGGGAAGGLSGFSRTPEGKAAVAAFMDAYNNLVVSLRNYKAQEVKGGPGKGGVLKVGD